MRWISGRRVTALACAALGLLLMTGCDTSQITFLDVVQTALLGVTAAGSLVLIRNV
jgi:hypothetical protein